MLSQVRFPREGIVKIWFYLFVIPRNSRDLVKNLNQIPLPICIGGGMTKGWGRMTKGSSQNDKIR